MSRVLTLGERLRLGVGIDGNAVRYEALGEDLTNGGRRREERIAYIAVLWAVSAARALR